MKNWAKKGKMVVKSGVLGGLKVVFGATKIMG